MSLGTRVFVEFLINKIKSEGIKSECYFSYEEVESDLIDMIWDAYEDFEK